MQFRDLKAQYGALKTEMDAAVAQVLANCNFISGKQVEELEHRLEAYTGMKHCVTCGNGTDALTLALMSWDLQPTDAIFVPDFTFFASAETIAFEGAVPVFVDVEAETFNLSPQSLERAIRRVLEEGRLTPKGVIAVDLFGLPADYPAIREIADRYGLKILEDAAQGFGGRIGAQRACSFGDIACTSFFPAKPLGCYGDGGAVFTNDDGVAEYLRSIRVHGKGGNKYDNVRIGMNSRLDTLQAAVLLVKLDAFERYELADVNRAAEVYTQLLGDCVCTPAVPEGFLSSWAQYTLRLKDQQTRDGLQAFLKEHGVPSMIYYPKGMHQQQAFAAVACDEGQVPVSAGLCRTVLSLPMHPYLTPADAKQVAELVREYLNQ